MELKSFNMNLTIVTAAIIEDNGKILISQRKPETHKGLKWEFPGGKLEEDETPEECIVREIKEELGLEIETRGIFDVIYHKYSSKTVLLLVYKCKVKGGQARAIDCNDFKWVDATDLEQFDYPEADLPIVKKLLKI